MRRSASFPVQNIALTKAQILAWLRRFEVCCFLDNNNYEVYRHRSFELMAGAGQASVLQIAADQPFDSLHQYLSEKQDFIFGFFSYDLKNTIEPVLNKSSKQTFEKNIDFPLVHFFQPEHVIQIRVNRLFISSLNENPQNVFVAISRITPEQNKTSNPVHFEIKSRETKLSYIQKIEQIRKHIEEGDVYEVNFCNEFYAENAELNAYNFFEELNSLARAPFSCFYRLHDQYLLSASPERFLHKTGSRLISQPIKGTAKRGQDMVQDLVIQSELQNDEKERAENVMIVDLVRNDLARSCKPGSVEVEELFGVYPFEKVNHLVSTVTGEMRSDCRPVDAIKNAFPMGSMTGAPKIAAMKMIDKLEKVDRGLFSGAVGYFTPKGDFDFNVVIRSALYNAVAKFLSFSVGGAVTYDSVAEKEHAEMLLKAEGVLESLG